LEQFRLKKKKEEKRKEYLARNGEGRAGGETGEGLGKRMIP
jgi:hypothetical protein